jgi:pyruvate/2-oxoglutarate dehydrogenase complex dihydrolipoamide acyltransferase (E2) component
VVGGGVLDLLPWPKVDFAKFGEIEVKPLSRIKKISGQNLSRNWVMIPAVTYHEDADITDIEAFRVLLNKENEKGGGAKLTMLAFLIKACVKGLQKFPEFNSSLDGDNLVLKKYFNIGFAADTPNGLVVPVVKNVDKKSVSNWRRNPAIWPSRPVTASSSRPTCPAPASRFPAWAASAAPTSHRSSMRRKSPFSASTSRP